MPPLHQCALGCLSPPIGEAELASPYTSGRYPLCTYHYHTLIEGKWTGVTLKSWTQTETLPCPMSGLSTISPSSSEASD